MGRLLEERRGRFWLNSPGCGISEASGEAISRKSTVDCTKNLVSKITFKFIAAVW
jgi:hypothetical protein